MSSKNVVDTDADLTPPAQATTPTTENEAPPAAPVLDAAQWQAKLDGMRGTAIKHQKAVERLSVELVSARQELEETKLSLEQERDLLRARTLQLEQEAKEASEKATKLEKQQALTLKVRSFQGLDDLLPELLQVGVQNMAEEEQVAYLERLSGKLAGLVDVKKDRFAAGATPPAAPPADRKTPTMSFNDAWANLEAARSRYGDNSKEYRAAYNIYVDMVNDTPTGLPT